MDRDGTSEAPGRQLADCRGLAEREGLDVVEVYEDRASAYTRSSKRPAYERLLADLSAGRIDTVIVWKLDRLTRRGVGALGPFLADGVRVASVVEGVDTRTPEGETILAILAGQAKGESRNTSVRIRRQQQAAAEAGEFHTGGQRAYGYSRAGEVVDAEAAVIREAARRALAGESWRGIALDLNERGVTTSTGGRWYANSLVNVVRSPRLAGFRVHRGRQHRGAWTPILTVAEHDALRRTRGESRTLRQRQNLLVGLVWCGRCGGRMRTMGAKAGQYQCHSQPGAENCGRVTVSQAPAEAHVVDTLLTLLAAGHLRPGKAKPKESDEQLEQRVSECERSITELTRAHFVDRVIGYDDFLGAQRELEERAAAAEAELARREEERERARRVRGLRPGSRADLDAWWAAATAEERYDAVHAAVERVTVNPAVQRGNRFDTRRVVVELNWELLEQIAGVSWLAVHEHLNDTAT